MRRGRITLKKMMSYRPCRDNYPLGRVKKLWDGRVYLEYREIAGLDIPALDRLWALRKFMTNRQLHIFACDVAESVLHLVPEGEDRPRNAIEIRRRWLRGEASDDERSAAAAAADAAAYADASAAAAAAADAAAYADASADAAAYADASAAAYAAADAAAAAAAAAAAYAAAAAAAYADAAAAADAARLEQREKNVQMAVRVLEEE